jgi:hypothetical protein
MIRNLKTLGLALVAISALSAVVASVALAQGKFTSDGPVTMTAEETGEEGKGLNALTAFGLKIECPTSIYTGHKYNVTPNEFLPNGVTTATVTPHYKQIVVGGDANCRANPASAPVTIQMNGCDYVIHLGATTGGVNGTYALTIDIVCPEGQEIAITVWTTNELHTANATPFCVLNIPPQTGLVGAHITDTGNGHVDVGGAVEGIQMTRKNNTGAADTHTVICPETTSMAGKFDLDLTTKGHNQAGEPTAVSLSD